MKCNKAVYGYYRAEDLGLLLSTLNPITNPHPKIMLYLGGDEGSLTIDMNCVWSNEVQPIGNSLDTYLPKLINN